METTGIGLADIYIWQWLLVLISFLVIHWYFSIPKGIPPGPYGVPFLGYLPFLGRRPHETLSSLGKKYSGGIFSLYFGNRLVIVLNDYEHIKEAFIKQGNNFAGRPKDLNIDLNPEAACSVVTTDGAYWREHRIFALSAFRDLGLGKSILEPKIMNEIQQFLEKVEVQNDQPHDISHALTLSIAKNIWTLVFGQSCNYSDEWLLSFIQTIREGIKVNGALSVQRLLPWLTKIPGCSKLIQADAYKNALTKVMNHCHDAVNMHEIKYVENSTDTYVNAFLTEKQTRLKQNPNENIFTKEGLVHNVRDFMAGGADTTTNTILWGLLTLMHYPEIQAKIQGEIDDVIGRDRLPSVNDRPRTPYTDSFIMEIWRCYTIVPLAVPHRNFKETTISGYKIPADTHIVPNLWHVHHNPKLWKDPDVFRPERFLSEDNTAVLKLEYFIPFSQGKRQCLGESFARMESYLYFTAMLQRFTFLKPEGIPLPPLVPVGGFVLSPLPFTTCAVSRNLNPKL